MIRQLISPYLPLMAVVAITTAIFLFVLFLFVHRWLVITLFRYKSRETKSVVYDDKVIFLPKDSDPIMIINRPIETKDIYHLLNETTPLPSPKCSE